MPAGLPWFAGHFPGRPVLPGVAHLALVEQAIRALAPGRFVSRLARVRFRKPVAPGTRLELDLTLDVATGAARFVLREGAGIASDGSLGIGEWGDEAPHAGTGRPEAGAPAHAIEALVPHRGAMRFVESVFAERPDGAEVIARVAACGPFDDDGRAPSLLAVEMAAQAMAALATLRRERASGVAATGGGALVGISDVVLTSPWLPAGRALRVVVHDAPTPPPLAACDAIVAEGDHVLMQGRITAWLLEP